MGCHRLLHMDYCSTIKQNEMLPLATMWMDLECIMFSEVSQVEKDKLLYDVTYITKKKQAHRYREQTSGYQWGERREEG